MYYYPYMNIYPWHYFVQVPPYDYNRQVWYGYTPEVPKQEHDAMNNNNRVVRDHGKQPFVVDIEKAAEQNRTFRTALWTGEHLQVTLMSIRVGEDIGLEVHPSTDQFLRIEEGKGIVQMGDSKNNLTFRQNVQEDSAIFVPAGTWHNVTNTGNVPLKLYSIYAPPEHPFGTVHVTKKDAIAAEHA
ncbi:cupin domain-containing protein [Lentibacillus daqui]|uniref:cupin domain-containing protein n=1 Tax=Lentibacillus daqui TaxID=2911514 RepID=UPI0022B0ED86|nr:cupin domain-containing protein [Lentibacillus daqui]